MLERGDEIAFVPVSAGMVAAVVTDRSSDGSGRMDPGTAPLKPPMTRGGSFVFLLVPGIPAILSWSAILGSEAGWADAFAYLPLAVALSSSAAINILHPGGIESFPQAVTPAWRLYFRFLPLLAVPLQAVALCVAVAHACSGLLSAAGLVGWTVSTGLFCALLAVTVGHELIHRPERLDRALGGVLLSLVCFGAFKVVHRQDPPPLRRHAARLRLGARDQSLYAFLARAFAGNFREAVRYERRKLQRFGQSFWRSELAHLVRPVARLAGAGGDVVGCGRRAVLPGAEPAGHPHPRLDQLHSALRPDPPGGSRRAATSRCSRTMPGHSTARSPTRVLLNLLRHGDHHTYPQRPYQSLVERAGPAYPYPFGIILLLALVTPAFRRIVHPLLDQLDKEEHAAAGS